MQCNDTASGTGACECREGFTGDRCEECTAGLYPAPQPALTLVNCTDGADCDQGGFCTVECNDDGYTYDDCSNKGTCNGQGGCDCDAGFVGDSCEFACNAATDCSGNGICMDTGECKCDAAYAELDDCS